MNLKEYKGNLCLSRHLLPAIALCPTHETRNVRNWQETEFHISNFESHRYLGRKIKFFTLLGFDIQRNADHESPKIKLYSARG